MSKLTFDSYLAKLVWCGAIRFASPSQSGFLLRCGRTVHADRLGLVITQEPLSDFLWIGQGWTLNVTLNFLTILLTLEGIFGCLLVWWTEIALLGKYVLLVIFLSAFLLEKVLCRKFDRRILSTILDLMLISFEGRILVCSSVYHFCVLKQIFLILILTNKNLTDKNIQ